MAACARRVLPLVVALVCFAAAPSAAAATISFYTHGWGMRGVGYVYFPHAFVVLERAADEPGGPSRESYGFTASSPDSVMLTGRSGGVINTPDERYSGQSRLHFSMRITYEQYQAIEDAIERWRNTDGNRYDLDRRNCISFVAELGRVLGLSTPDRVGRDPAGFMERVRAANLERVISLETDLRRASGQTEPATSGAPPSGLAVLPGPVSAAAQP